MRLRIRPPSFRSTRPTPAQLATSTRLPTSVVSTSPFFYATRSLAHLQPDHVVPVSASFSRPGCQQQETHFDQPPDRPPPDERTLKLGKTLRILQARLPTLLASPLPPEILSPHITLHLFPSTHPHLPTVSGRVAYHAALWTSPITWGRVPLVGNVNLEIQSERMVKNGAPILTGRHHQPPQTSGEKLIVRWRTCGKTKGLGTGANFRGVGAKQTVDKITMWLGGTEKRDDEEFCGLFIFEFDEAGRIADHVIERAEGDDGWDAEPSRWVGLTDWLLGRFGKGFTERTPGLALGYQRLGRKRGNYDSRNIRRI